MPFLRGQLGGWNLIDFKELAELLWSLWTLLLSFYQVRSEEEACVFYFQKSANYLNYKCHAWSELTKDETLVDEQRCRSSQG